MTIQPAFEEYRFYEQGGQIHCKSQGHEVVNWQTIDFKGSFCVTEDRKRKGWLHVLIYLCQRIYAFFHGIKLPGIDPHFNHSFILQKFSWLHDEAGKTHLMWHISHGVFGGIKQHIREYLKEEDVTGITIFRPKNPGVREQLVTSASKTAFLPPTERKSKSWIERAKKCYGSFSIPDLIQSFSMPQGPMQNVHLKKRLAYLTADLLLGEQLRDRHLRPRSFFCTAYAICLLQATLLAQAAKTANLQQGLTRDALAQRIFSELKTPGSQVFKTYYENPVCLLNGRFTMSAWAVKTLQDSC